MKTKQSSTLLAEQPKLGTPTHPLKFGDSVQIMNTTMGGKVIVEGFGKILRATSVDDRYVVRFENGDEVERFVENH